MDKENRAWLLAKPPHRIKVWRFWAVVLAGVMLTMRLFGREA